MYYILTIIGLFFEAISFAYLIRYGRKPTSTEYDNWEKQRKPTKVYQPRIQYVFEDKALPFDIYAKFIQYWTKIRKLLLVIAVSGFLLQGLDLFYSSGDWGIITPIINHLSEYGLPSLTMLVIIIELSMLIALEVYLLIRSRK